MHWPAETRSTNNDMLSYTFVLMQEVDVSDLVCKGLELRFILCGLIEYFTQLKTMQIEPLLLVLF